MADALNELAAAYRRGRQDALTGLIEGFMFLEKSQDVISVSAVIEIVMQLRQMDQVAERKYAETTLAITQ